MTTAEQITKQLNEEYDSFLNLPYAGKIPPPSFIIDLFKKAIMAMPPYAHKINFRKVKVIAGMKVEELTNGLLQDVIKVVLNTSLDKLYGCVSMKKGKDLEDAMEGRKSLLTNNFCDVIEKQIEIEKFVLAYNNHVDGFKKKLEMKKVNLESLSGLRNNGMRIIPQA